ncbi:MAG: hypothetical protein P8M34_15035 [Saprospiraceae bacterium]|nr:hypothetical protein [Saprospiraceae bacterium]
MKTLFTSVLLFTSLILFGQLSKKQKILGERFDSYSGQIFYFEDFLETELYIKGAEQTFKANEANLNLVTKAIEVYRGGKIVEIARKKFTKVAFNKNGHEISMIPSPLTDGFIFNLYETPKYRFFHEILPTIENRIYNIPGKVYERNFVRNKHTYTLYIKDEPHTVELKKKGILKLLGSEADRVAKKTKNKLKDEWDVVALLTALEQNS